MGNITKVKFLKISEPLPKDGDCGSQELALVALEEAMPFQCELCIKRKGCSKRGDEEFCLDWERD